MAPSIGRNATAAMPDGGGGIPGRSGGFVTLQLEKAVARHAAVGDVARFVNEYFGVGIGKPTANSLCVVAICMLQHAYGEMLPQSSGSMATQARRC